MMKRINAIHLTLAVCLLFVVFQCIPSTVNAAPKEVRVGTSISKTGPMAAFGLYQEWGYTTVVKDINKAGGIYLSKYGKKLPVKLFLYDDQSMPNKSVQNTERLILKNEVHGLLSPATPPMVIPAAVVADREGIPMSAALCPIRAFLGARDQWTWVWDMFFDELDMSRQQMLTMNTVKSNRKVALFTDNEQDGIIQGKLWNQYAKELGYEIVYHAKFPLGTTEYGDLIRRAQEGKADIIIAQMIPPDSIALWKQMQSLGYKPKAAFFEKGGESMEWWKANGKSAQGTMVAGYWHPELGYPGAKELRARFEKDTGEIYSQHIADTYVAAQILFDAIERAGNLDPKAINNEMSKTDKTYLIGPVKYTEGKGAHAAALKTFMLQWQDGDTQIVYPSKWATGKMIYPLP
ncbi:MAG: amino acid ABC transporter substrate-binding protein [Deltaproteobacteria bacterium]|nr:amino acid ABC transporter substrate-binding protein [Deltaproteobacteria bacterium]